MLDLRGISCNGCSLAHSATTEQGLVRPASANFKLKARSRLKALCWWPRLLHKRTPGLQAADDELGAAADDDVSASAVKFGRTTVTVHCASAATLAATLPSSVRSSEFCR